MCVLDNEHLKDSHDSLKKRGIFVHCKKLNLPSGTLNNPVERGRASLNMSEFHFINTVSDWISTKVNLT